MRKLFVSYARENKPDVDQLVEHLATMGYETWVDAALRGGQDWWEEILDRIADTDVVIAIYSSAALNSTACAREYEWATALGKPVVPVAVEPPPSALPSRFARRQIVDYSQPLQRPSAALKLQGALAAIPPAPPLPNPLPDSPRAPLSYLTDLIDVIAQASPIDHDQQHEILLQIDPALISFDPLERRGGREILERLSRRRDLYADVDRAIHRLRDLATYTEPVVDRKMPIDATPAPVEPREPPAKPPLPVAMPSKARTVQELRHGPAASSSPEAPADPPQKEARSASTAMSRRAFACVLAGVALVSITVVDNLALGLATMISVWSVMWTFGVVFVVVGRGQSVAGKTIAGTALISLGLSAIVETLIARRNNQSSLFYSPSAMLPVAMDAIFALAGLLLIFIPARKHRASEATAAAYLLCGVAVVASTAIIGTAWHLSPAHAVVAAATGVVLMVGGAVSWWLTRRARI